jgi:hypothetical protein
MIKHSAGTLVSGVTVIGENRVYSLRLQREEREKGKDSRYIQESGVPYALSDAPCNIRLDKLPCQANASR